MDRRQFVKASTAGMSTLAAGLGIKDVSANSASGPGTVAVSASADKIGRPVRIVSIGLTEWHPPVSGSPSHARSLEEVAGLVDKEGENGTDLIILPETWRGQNEKSQESLEGPTITTMARLA